jgi:UDP-2-acetamido-3-amino-2,3-dideoxy-glucuronate N-acetyltransferase
VELTASDIAPGLLVSEEVEIGSDVQFGANVVLHRGVRIGDGCVILDGGVIGKLPHRGAHFRTPEAEWAPTVIEPGAVISCGAVISVGARIGRNAFIGDNVLVREQVVVDVEAAIGVGGSVGPGAVVGARAKVMSRSGICGGAVLEEDVFVGPGVEMVSTEGTGPDRFTHPPLLRRGCRLGANVSVLAGTEVGEGSIVGAGAVLTADVPPRTLSLGAPARVVRELEPHESAR